MGVALQTFTSLLLVSERGWYLHTFGEETSRHSESCRGGLGIWILEEEKKIQRRSLELRAENTPDSDGEAGR